MKIKNIEVGMQVEVKKKAFTHDDGSLASVYSEVPLNRLATVLECCPYSGISIEMDDSGDEWLVSSSEIRVASPVKFYKFDDGVDCFIIRGHQTDSEFLIGKVVCVIKGNPWHVGYSSDEWDIDQFDECDFKVEGM